MEHTDNQNKGGLPAGTVTNTPQGQAALQRIGAMNLEPGQSADAVQGQLGEPYTEFKAKSASFRTDYRVPSNNPQDTSKQEAYIKENRALLKDHKWMPNIRAILEGEVKAVNKDLTVLKDGMKLEKDMQGAELNKLRAEAKSKLTKKAGISGKDYNAMAANAIPDINAAANKIDKVFGSFIDRASNFTKNVIGRHHEQYDLHNAIGSASAHLEQQVPGSVQHGVNSKLLDDATDSLHSLRGRVRRDRTNAAVASMGAAGVITTVNDEMQRRREQYKYATENTHTTYQLSTERGSIAGDALHAIETINAEPVNTKKKLLAAVAVAAISAGGLAYGTNKIMSHPELARFSTSDARAGMQMGKVVAEVLPYVTGAGGAYYAYQNRDNPTKRNIGLGVTGLSAVARGVLPISNDFANVPDIERTGRAIATASSVGLLGSVGYAAHRGQEIANHESVENAMHSHAPEEDVAHAVNTVRGKHSLLTKYPVSRYLKIPSAVTRLVNSRMGVPAGAMNDGDKAYYHEAQVDVEFNRLKKQYEANLGRLTHAGHTDLRELAMKNVTERDA